MENPSVAPHVDDRAGTSDGRLGLVLGIISIAAAVYAGWLSKIKLDSLYSCDATVFNSCKDQKAGCNLVFSSPWSEIAGYPVTVFATAFYVALVVLGLLWTAKSEWVPGHYRPVLLGAGLMAVAVTVAMAGYATIEFHTFCEYCAGLYLVSAALLGLAFIAREGTVSAALRALFAFEWLSPDGTKLIVGLTTVFITVVWIEIGVYDGLKAAALGPNAKCTVESPVDFPKTNLVMGSQTPLVHVAEFIDLSCPFCRQQSEDLEKWLRKDLPSIQLHLYMFPRDRDSKCCNACRVDESSAAQSCLGALVLDCVAIHRGPGDALKLLTQFWKDQEVWRPSELVPAPPQPLFTEPKLAASVGLALQVNASAAEKLVRECLNDEDVIADVRNQVIKGEDSQDLLPESDRKNTPFAFLFAGASNELKGKPDFLAGKKPLGTWINSQRRVLEHARH